MTPGQNQTTMTPIGFRIQKNSANSQRSDAGLVLCVPKSKMSQMGIKELNEPNGYDTSFNRP